MEERQDRLTQDLQTLMVEIRRCRQPHDGASNHGDSEESEGAAARRAREQGRRNQMVLMVEEGNKVEDNESDDSEDVDVVRSPHAAQRVK